MFTDACLCIGMNIWFNLPVDIKELFGSIRGLGIGACKQLNMSEGTELRFSPGTGATKYPMITKNVSLKWWTSKNKINLPG